MSTPPQATGGDRALALRIHVPNMGVTVEHLTAQLSAHREQAVTSALSAQSAELEALKADLAALTAERDELRKDRERLDWLLKTAKEDHRLVWTGNDPPEPSHDICTLTMELEISEREHEDARAAIDAARATPTGGAGENAGARREEP